MKKQNKVLSVIVSVAVLIGIGFTVGCQSGPNPQQAASMVQAAAQLGTYQAVKADPGLRAPLQLVSVSIVGMCNSGVFDTVALEAAINNAFGASPQNAIYMETAITLYDGYVASIVQAGLGTNQYIQPVECALGAGIQAGLNATATTAQLKLKYSKLSVIKKPTVVNTVPSK